MVPRFALPVIGLALFLVGCKSGEIPRMTGGSESVQNRPRLRVIPVSAGSERTTDAVTRSQTLTLEQVVEQALARHSSIKAAEWRLAAAAARVPQAASLKDPMLGVEGWPFYPHVPQTVSGRMTSDVMVSQEVPWFGKRRNDAAAAAAEMRAAQAELAGIRLRVVEEAKRTCFQLHYARLGVDIIRRDREILTLLEDVAEARYATGKSGQQEVVRLRAETLAVETELIRLRQNQDAARAELVRLLRLPVDAVVDLAVEIEPSEATADLGDLYERALRQRPELQNLASGIHRERHEMERRRLDYYPDMTLKMGWGQMTASGAMSPAADGLDNISLGFGVNLPVNRHRLSAAVREAEANSVAAIRDYEQMREETKRDVRRLFSEALSERDTELLLRESIIPLNEQGLRAAVRGYEVGETEFAELIAAWRELLRLHIAQIEAESRLRQTLASLERVVGGSCLQDSPSAGASD